MAVVPDRKASAHVLAAKLSSFAGCNIYVEGPIDVSFWKCHCKKENVKIRAVRGCDQVIENVQKSNEQGIKCIGIIDKDFRDFFDFADVPENVYILDDHDLEMMIYHSGDYENALNVYDKSEKIAKYEEGGIPLYETVATIVRRIAALRFCSIKNHYNLAFCFNNKEEYEIIYPDYEKILDKRSLVYLGDEKLIEYIVNWTDKKRTVYEHNRTTIKNSLDEEDVAGFDDWSFLNGHDFTLLLLLVLNKKIRLKNPQITLEQFEDSLILSMGKEYLSTTSIYQSLANWSDANGISILK